MCDRWPTQGEEVDLDSGKIYPFGCGLVYRPVCAPKNLTDEEIGDIVSRNDPPGTSANRWEVSSDESAEDHPNWSERSGSKTARAQCPDHPDRHHVLMNC